MVTRWKIDNYVLILLKMYLTTFSNISGNALKIVTNKNGAKFPYMVTCMVMRIVTRGNAFYKSTRDTKRRN